MARRLKIGALEGSLFDHCLIDEHDWDIVVYRVHAFALSAFEARPVGFQFDFDLANGTREYFEKSLAYRHLTPPVVEAEV